MVSVSDLLTLLDKVPVWKRIKELPDRIVKLESRVSELEGKLGKPLSKDACPKCGERQFFVEHSRTVGAVGLQERIYKCRACEFVEKRREKP
jgi:DNA-directed RNA polymerase subunit M/transcription elongation factor TFIIS